MPEKDSLVWLSPTEARGSGFMLVGAFERQARRQGWPESKINAVLAEVSTALVIVLSKHLQPQPKESPDAIDHVSD